MLDSYTLTQNRSLLLTKVIGFYLSIATPIILLVAASHFLESYQEEANWKSSQLIGINSVKANIANDYYTVLSDIMFLAENRALFNNTQQSNLQLTDTLKRFAENRRSYYQLRFINTNGNEVVRVNYMNNQVDVVSQDQLQNKSSRDYFKNSINLQPRSVFVSRFDLNQEHGQIEHPLRPVIRFITPVVNKNNVRQGILVLNYLGDRLLTHFDTYNKQHDERLLLINDQGYYLYSDQLYQSWGFQLDNRGQISDDFPAAKTILSTDSGQFIDDTGLFTYESVSKFEHNDQSWLDRFTLTGSVKIISAEAPWKIVSFVDNKQIHQQSNVRLQLELIIVVLLLLILLPLSILWAHSRIQLDKLSQRNKLYAQVVEQSDELIYITDPEGTILYANEAVSRHTGYKLDEIIGSKPSIFKAEIQPEVFYQQLWNTIQSGQPFTNLVINQKKDGDTYYELKVITPLKDSRGNITHYISTGRNITHERHLYQREMDIANRLAGGVMHHFGNLMTLITGYTELALKQSNTQSESLSNYHRNILSSSDKIIGILRKMRDIAYHKIENDQLIDTRQVVNQFIEHYRNQLPNNISLTTSVANKIPEIYFTEDMLKNALEALVQNAVEAMPEGGKIEINIHITDVDQIVCSSCHELLTNQYLEISVIDNGPGIADNIIEHVWDPFFTGKETGKEVGITPGLGLSSVRSIIHAHNGHIVLQTSNSGTCIRLLFDLPAEIPEPNSNILHLVS